MSIAHDPTRADEEALETLEWMHGRRDEFTDFVRELCAVESPTDNPESQRDVHAILEPAFRELGYEVRRVPGRISGDHFYAVPKGRPSGRPVQMLVGHTDTVWPMGTLHRMPLTVEGDTLSGPGTLDMKGGVTQILFALRALRELGRTPSVDPIVFVNSDEETGSPDSVRHVKRLARSANRAFVLEPALGDDGLIKTARKGVGHFSVVAHGRASHAGLDPLSGASAIVELAHVIQTVTGLTDHDRGTTLNVGVVSGGTRPNVIAAEARCAIDVRVESIAEGEAIERAMAALTARDPDVRLEIEGGIKVPPLERTERNQALWSKARSIGSEMGFSLDHALAGGGSDGNTTSLFTATLDGLGCVGDGAHADHEHIRLTPTLDRCALLAHLLMMPDLAS
ncbi:MAG: M20 family metallopeptidase [Gemmatimonadota bacterium]